MKKIKMAALILAVLVTLDHACFILFGFSFSLPLCDAASCR